MSLIEVLCWLREELPLVRRQAPKLSSPAESARHLRLPSQTRGPVGRCAPQELTNVVEVMFRKARLKRCFQHIFRQQQNDDENRQQAVSAASPPGLVLQRPGAGSLDARVERRIRLEQAEPPPQLVGLHPVSWRAEDVIEPRSPDLHAPAVDPRPLRGEGDDEAERARRRILLRRFFHAARRRDLVRRNDRLDLGRGGTPAAAGGAPCFTVGGGGSGTSSVTSERVGGQHGPGNESAGVRVDDRLRRANLLRRILHALRESARERVLETAPSTAPLSPTPQDHLPRPPSLPAPQLLRVQNEPPPPPPVPVGPLLHPTTHPPGGMPAGEAAVRATLPVHPRQATRTAKAYQAVFQALAALLPSCPIGEVSAGRGCGAGAGAGGGLGKMQAAAARCGVQCQGYIRALQNGVEVTRSCATGEDIQAKLILRPASADGAGVALALHDMDFSGEPAAAVGGIVGGNAAPRTPPRRAPAFVLLPLAHVTRVRCLTVRGQSFGFSVLAAGAPGDAWGGHAARSQGGAQARAAAAAEEVDPFGILRATSGEDFRTLVLGVASVKSALDSPFRTRKTPHLGTRGRQPTANPPSGSACSGLPTTSSPAAAAAIPSATAAACLPWQGARVCIVELAPSLTFLGAVRAVEAEAWRVGRENGLTLRDQNLLVCADHVEE